MSRIPSKPIEIATITVGSPFVLAAVDPDGRVSANAGRLPHPGFYKPDSLEIEFVGIGGVGTIAGPILLDCWTLDVEANTEINFYQLELSADAITTNDVLPPVIVKGGTRAVSLRTGNVGAVNAQARVRYIQVKR